MQSIECFGRLLKGNTIVVLKEPFGALTKADKRDIYSNVCFFFRLLQMEIDSVVCCFTNCFDTNHVVKYSTQRDRNKKCLPKIYILYRTWPLTDCVCVAVVMQASSGYRLAAKKRITLKAVTEFFQEPEHIGDAADRGQSQGMLLLVKIR